MDKLISFSDPSIVVDNICDKDSSFLIKIHRKGKFYCCPKCGNKTKSVHSIKTKHIQDLPIQNKCVILEVCARLFVCRNCNIKFIESFETSQPKAQRTDRLDKYILDIAVNNSSLVSTEILNKNGVKIKKTCICKLLKKNKDQY